MFYNFCDFIFLLIFYFRESNLYSRFLIFAFWYLLSTLYLSEPNLQYPFLLEGEIAGLIALSPFWLSFFSTRSPLSPPSRFSSLPNSVNLFVCSGLWRTLSQLITGWTCLSPVDPPLSSWPSLSPSSLFSSSCNSVNVSEGSGLWGAHREVVTA